MQKTIFVLMLAFVLACGNTDPATEIDPDTDADADTDTTPDTFDLLGLDDWFHEEDPTTGYSYPMYMVGSYKGTERGYSVFHFDSVDATDTQFLTDYQAHALAVYGLTLERVRTPTLPT